MYQGIGDMMKNPLNKFLKKKNEPLPSKITSDTVIQHREQVLAGGRKFKYPIQYAKHKLVFNAIIISVLALVAVIIVGWWQLYPAQNTSNFMYRVTKFIPVPVAKIDGQFVSYSDYLMKYLSSIHYLKEKEQLNLNTDDGRRQIDYVKQQSLKDAIADSYAMKLAKKMNISVSDSELQAFLVSQRQSSGLEISEQSYDAVILEYYDWSPAEYAHATRNKLIRQKVSFAMDDVANKLIDQVSDKVQSTADLKAIVDSINADSDVKLETGSSGWVPKDNQDGGLAAAAQGLEENQISKAIKSANGDAYYFVKLIDLSDTQVSYEYIKVPLTVFSKAFDEIMKSNKVQKYISVQ
jgi:hypothetical protein